MSIDPGMFGDGQVFVDFSKNANVVEDLQLQTQAIIKWLAQLDGELQELMSSWEGEDQDAYRQRQTEWNNTVTAMSQMLQNSGGLLENVSQAFRDNQNKSTQSWQDLNVRV